MIEILCASLLLGSTISCYEWNNPFDENSSSYQPPMITIDYTKSSIYSEDTTHFDNAIISLSGNKPQSLFRIKVDKNDWTTDWQVAGPFGFSGLSDGKHVLRIESKYSGGDSVVSDSVSFYVKVRGYKPEFSVKTDTTFFSDTGKTVILRDSAISAAELNYIWMKRGTQLKNQTNNTLKIESISFNDTATYLCIASNEFGSDTCRKFILKYKIPTGGISGFVADAVDNRMLSGVKITLLPNNINSATDTNGLFTFKSLSAKTYSITISSTGYIDSGVSNIVVDSETKSLPTIKLNRVITCKVVYLGNGNDTGSIPVDGSSYIPGAVVTIRGNSGKLFKKGYTFSGWCNAKDGKSPIFSPADTHIIGKVNDTLYAVWKTNQYSVTFIGSDNTSGNSPVEINRNYKETVSIPDKGTLERAGYTFSGWNTRQDGKGSSFAVAATFSMPDSAVVLFAQWTALPTYKVTYNKNSADTGVVPVDTNNYYKGKEVTVSSNLGNLYRDGFAFVGWNTKTDGKGDSYNVGAKFPMPDTAVTLYVKWTTNPTFSIIYHDKASNGGAVPSTTTADSGTVVTIADSGTLYKTGYTFVAWNTKEDGSGKEYKTGDKVIMGTLNIDLYSQWTKAQFTITYYGNGSTGGVIPQKATSLYQNEITIASPGELAKVGYSFVGWNADTAETGFDYQPGIKIVVTKNINLYARWVKKKFRITFFGNGDRTSNVPDITEYVYGSTIDSSSVVPSRQGYVFKGWYRDSLTNDKWYYTSDLITSVDTLYAKWVIQDINGNTYNEVKIGNQVWMVENLKTTKYRDGTVIPMVADSAAWASLSNHGYCWYDNDSATLKNLYGALYNWYVADPGNPHKIAPEGWHIPDSIEWNTLIKNLGGWSIAAGKMKADNHWVISDENATNESGFSALPGGYRYNYGGFRYINEMAFWWTTTFTDTFYRICYQIFTEGGISIDPFIEKGYGLSIRCIRD